MKVKKLNLKRETVANLNDVVMKNLKGGVTAIPTPCPGHTEVVPTCISCPIPTCTCPGYTNECYPGDSDNYNTCLIACPTEP